MQDAAKAADALAHSVERLQEYDRVSRQLTDIGNLKLDFQPALAQFFRAHGRSQWKCDRERFIEQGLLQT